MRIQHEQWVAVTSWPPDRYKDFIGVELRGEFKETKGKKHKRSKQLNKTNIIGKLSKTMTTFYCVKEKKKVDIEDYEVVTLKNGRPAARAVCPNCGCKVIRFLPKNPTQIDGAEVINAKKDGK